MKEQIHYKATELEPFWECGDCEFREVGNFNHLTLKQAHSLIGGIPESEQWKWRIEKISNRRGRIGSVNGEEFEGDVPDWASED